MCTFAPTPGWSGILVGLPAPDAAATWALLLLPFVLPPLLYLFRPLYDAIALPFLRFGPVSTVRPPLRWFVTQSALIMLTCATVTFAVLPSYTAWSVWLAHERAVARPECRVTLETFYRDHSDAVLAVFLVVGFLPWAVAVVRDLISTYAPDPAAPQRLTR